MLRRFAGALSGTADLQGTRPPHAAIARVWLLGDAFVLRARPLDRDTMAGFHRERDLVGRVRPLLRWALPELVPTDDREPFALSDDALWTLHRQIPGRILCPWQDLHRAPAGDRRRLVEALKELHLATAGRLDAADASWLLNGIRAWYDGIRPLLSPRAHRTVEDALQRHGTASARVRPGDAAFVHGDFHWGNLLIDGSGAITGLLDLDWCRAASPVEDLAYTAMMLCRDCQGGRHRLDALEDAADWYGLPPQARDAFRHACVLYSVFDVHLFQGSPNLPHRQRYVDLQVDLVEAICKA